MMRKYKEFISCLKHNKWLPILLQISICTEMLIKNYEEIKIINLFVKKKKINFTKTVACFIIIFFLNSKNKIAY